MTLGFSTKINGKPNYFPEKIITGLDIPDYKKMTLMDCLSEVVPHTMEEFLKGSTNPNFPHKPKIHTIREDKNGRWKAGMNIHMVINNRAKNRFQFAPTLKCVSVQPFKIEWINGTAWVTIGHRSFTTFKKTDVGYEYGENAKELAFNDGFDSVEYFFTYFNKDFRGSLIHWTDLTY